MSFRLRQHCLLGNLEESLLSDRIKSTRTMDGFQAEIVATDCCTIFCPNHRLPVTTNFYTIPADLNRPSQCYMARIELDKRGYRVPPKGTVQVTLMNPCGSVVKMFLVQYNLTDMPINSCTFVRQRILFCPTDSSDADVKTTKFLQYLIHLRFKSTKSGRIFLSNEIKVIVFQRSDLEAAAMTSSTKYESRSLLIVPFNPVYSTRIPSKRTKTRKRSLKHFEPINLDLEVGVIVDDQRRNIKGSRTVPEMEMSPPASPTSSSSLSLSSSASSSSFSFNFLSASPPIMGSLLGPLSPPLSSSPSPTSSLMKNPFAMDAMDGTFSYQSPSFPSSSSLFIPINSSPMIS